MGRSDIEVNELLVLACDHRSQFEEIARRLGVHAGRIPAFKRLVVRVAADASRRGAGVGVILDGQYGSAALGDADALGLWVARPVEEPGSRPLRFLGGTDPAAIVPAWPARHVVKCLCHYGPDDPADLRDAQDDALSRLSAVCRESGRDLLLEIIPPAGIHDRAAAVTRVIGHVYALGIRPAWWKLEPLPAPEDWQRIGDLVATKGGSCKGILMLGQTASAPELAAALAFAARQANVAGFAIGRAIVGTAFEKWLAGDADDDEAMAMMAAAFEHFATVWQSARRGSDTLRQDGR